ncbi:MAG: TlpA family protein disulfide reductase [Pedobacter sp.]|nr:MAG: TlpA family protein disulfide reductase [Pedobacter sp.]
MKNRLHFAKLFAIIFIINFSVENVSAQMAALVGQKAPKVVFQKSIDKPAKRDFYNNKILVLDFWATWCAPCIENLPHFNKLATKYGGDDFAFAIISDESEKLISNFFKNYSHTINAYNLSDISKTTHKNFGIQYIPSCVVIDKNNIVRWTGLGQDLNDEILLAVLNGTPVPTSKNLIEGIKFTEADMAAMMEKANLEIINKANRTTYIATIKDATNAKFAGSKGVNADGDITDLNYTNTTPAKLLEILTEYSKAQFVIDNPAVLNKLIDVHFSIQNSEIDPQDFENKYVAGMPLKNKMIDLILESIGMKAQKGTKVTDIYEVTVDNPAQLEKFKSFRANFSSISNKDGKVVMTAQQLKKGLEELKKVSGFMITTSINDTEKYDLIFDWTNEKALQKSLETHGLKFTKKQGEVGILTFSAK